MVQIGIDQQDRDNLDRIRTYLEAELPGQWLMKDPDRSGTTYYLSAFGSQTKHFVGVTEDFLHDHRQDVLAPLREWRLVDRLKKLAGFKRVVVADAGLEKEPV